MVNTDGLVRELVRARDKALEDASTLRSQLREMREDRDKALAELEGCRHSATGMSPAAEELESLRSRLHVALVLATKHTDDELIELVARYVDEAIGPCDPHADEPQQLAEVAVEAAARQIREANLPEGYDYTWEEIKESGREMWRDRAREVLDAYFGALRGDTPDVH